MDESALKADIENREGGLRHRERHGADPWLGGLGGSECPRAEHARNREAFQLNAVDHVEPRNVLGRPPYTLGKDYLPASTKTGMLGQLMSFTVNVKERRSIQARFSSRSYSARTTPTPYWRSRRRIVKWPRAVVWK